MSERIDRDFFSREEDEQADFLKYTWCEQCQKADLGMSEPVEYQIEQTIYIEGKCNGCETVVVTEIAADDDDE